MCVCVWVYCNCVIDSALMALSLLNVLDVFVARAAAFPAFISLYAAHNVPVAMRHGTTAAASPSTSSALYHVYFAGIKRFSGKYFTLSTHMCRVSVHVFVSVSVSVCGLPSVCAQLCRLPDRPFKRQPKRNKVNHKV